jgi:hypothetical protein
MQPHIQQHKAQRQHHEAIRHIARRRPAAYWPRAAIATFDPEAPPILAAAPAAASGRAGSG